MIADMLKGALAGAAGTAALDAVTYLDMAGRGRPASNTPGEAVTRLADKAGIGIPGEGEQRENRIAGLGPLLGIATGVAVGAAYGAVRAAAGRRPPLLLGAGLVGVAAMVGADTPLAVLRISDPRTWSAVDWLSDVVPHVAFGLVTAGTYALLDGPGRAGTGCARRPRRRGAC
ncbi:hypothetical protein ACIQGZ_09120 [Streptomyces sp. NPDC092296]|uniref:hypothetical protein n=1 Tax=Streptomyces sp. NPDC092296 TaxID=3366012 RepID=UPI00382E64B7